MKRAFLMSITILLVAGLAMPVLAKSGTDFGKKGKITFGGFAGYSMETFEIDAEGAKEEKTSTLKFAPAIGFFLMNNIEVGGILDYHSVTEEVGDSDSTTSGYGLAGFLNYHYLLSGTMFFTAGGKLGYASELVQEKDPEITAAGPYFGIKAGVTQTFGGKFGGWIFAGASYDYYMITTSTDIDGAEDQDATRTDLTVGTGLGVFF